MYVEFGHIDFCGTGCPHELGVRSFFSNPWPVGEQSLCHFGPSLPAPAHSVPFLTLGVQSRQVGGILSGRHHYHRVSGLYDWDSMNLRLQST